MNASIDKMTSFTYTTYIHAAPEQVWQGLTDPVFTKRYWRHHMAGPKTFHSDWKKGSTCGLGTRRCRARRERPRTGDPRVRSLPPAFLHLALIHARVGRRGWDGRRDC